jgi:hypothetical protein
MVGYLLLGTIVVGREGADKPWMTSASSSCSRGGTGDDCALLTQGGRHLRFPVGILARYKRLAAAMRYYCASEDIMDLDQRTRHATDVWQ